MLQGDYVEKLYVKLLRVTSIKVVKYILPLFFDSPSYYTASGIVTHVGGRPVHRLREDCAPDGHLQSVMIPDAV